MSILLSNQEEESKTDEARCMLEHMINKLIADMLECLWLFFYYFLEQVFDKKQTFLCCSPVVKVFVVEKVSSLTCGEDERRGDGVGCCWRES